MKDFSKIVASLFDFFIKEIEFNWVPAYQEAFKTLKESLKTTPMLQGSNWKLPFHIYTYASDTTIGVVLG